MFPFFFSSCRHMYLYVVFMLCCCCCCFYLFVFTYNYECVVIFVDVFSSFLLVPFLILILILILVIVVSSIRTLGAFQKLSGSLAWRLGAVTVAVAASRSMQHCNNNYKCCTINCKVNRLNAGCGRARNEDRLQWQNYFLLKRQRKCTYKFQTHTHLHTHTHTQWK